MTVIVVHWISYSDNVKFPFAVMIFFLVKFVSDISLSVEDPVKVVWSDIITSKFKLGYHQLFLANVDPFSGLIVLAFVYNFCIS